MAHIDTHRAHCCARHGCKYGHDDKCPVVLGDVKQDMPCEDCEEDEAMGLIIGYMDKVDFDEELGRALDGNRIFPSIEALRKGRPCCTQCGIVEVEIRLSRIIQETVDPNVRAARARTMRAQKDIGDD